MCIYWTKIESEKKNQSLRVNLLLNGVKDLIYFSDILPFIKPEAKCQTKKQRNIFSSNQIKPFHVNVCRDSLKGNGRTKRNKHKKPL